MHPVPAAVSVQDARGEVTSQIGNGRPGSGSFPYTGFACHSGGPTMRRLSGCRFVVVDVETTGLIPARDRIVEIAVELVDRDGSRVGGFETLVNPERDMGPTHIHGITADMVQDAPRFRDFAGSLLSWLRAGSIWVGHNAAFDIRFLQQELWREGLEIERAPVLCTLALARMLYPELGSHRLQCVCDHLGVPCYGAHSAGGDAVATAGLLARLLDDAARWGMTSRLARELAVPGLSLEPAQEIPGHSLPTCAIRFLPRGQALVQVQARRRSYVERLVKRLRPSGAFSVADEKLGLYLHLLDRSLEDRRIDEVEQEELLTIAEAWGLSLEDALRAHEVYLGMLIGTALEDGIVTENERADLGRVSDLLGLSRDRLNDLLQETTTSPTSLPTVTPRVGAAGDSALSGLSVCFTGVTPGPSGEPITREEAERLASEAGLFVARNVTKKLDLLVVADPETRSTKAVKARQYSTRIMAAEVFWRSIGAKCQVGAEVVALQTNVVDFG